MRQAAIETLNLTMRTEDMGHHIDDQGRFQSDKHPELPPDRIRLSFERKRSHPALAALAEAYQDVDPDLAEDIRARLRTVVAR